MRMSWGITRASAPTRCSRIDPVVGSFDMGNMSLTSVYILVLVGDCLFLALLFWKANTYETSSSAPFPRSRTPSQIPV